MNFGEKLSVTRKSRNLSQEQLAELIGVSRQSISKWENNETYPETEKLIKIAEKLQTSIDYLLMDKEEKMETDHNEIKNIAIAPNRLYVKAYNQTELVGCYKFSISSIFLNKKENNMPECLLLGVDGRTLFGEHSVILGYYRDLDDAQKEIAEINHALINGLTSYELKYSAKIKESFLGMNIKLVD